MKKLLGLALLIILLASATTNTNENTPYHSIQGTWELVSFYNYDDGIYITDTVPKAEGYRQVKMFYNGKVMWSRHDEDEPAGRFGYGSYKITDNQLIEHIEYGDGKTEKALDTIKEFTFELILKDDMYSQVNFNEEGDRTFSENYIRID